jgi:hypothetical protein
LKALRERARERAVAKRMITERKEESSRVVRRGVAMRSQ